MRLVVSKRDLVNLAFFLCFFPWLRFVPIQAETQPAAALVSSLILFRWGIRKDKLSCILLWFLFVVCIYWLFSLIDRPGYVAQVSLHTIPYVLPVLVFLALRDNLDLLSVRVYRVAFCLWAGLGLIQYFSIFSPIKPVIDGLLSQIIGRYQSGRVDNVRGVLFWGPEPATAVKVILLFLATGFYFYWRDRISELRFRRLILGVLVMIFMNKSGTGGLLMAFFAGAFTVGYLVTVWRHKGLAALILPAAGFTILSGIGIGAVIVMSRMGYESRFTYLGRQAWQSVTTGEPELRRVLMRGGGDRFPLVYVGYASLTHGYPLGHGAAGWITDMREMIRRCHDAIPEYAGPAWKPYSYGAAVAFDFGWIGLGLLLVFLYLCIHDAWSFQGTCMERGTRYALVLTAVFHILLLDMLSIPTPWVMLAMAMSDARPQTPIPTGG